MAQFKSLAAALAVALVALMPAPAVDAHALAVRGSELGARAVDHMELVRRQNRAKKRCPNRAGTTPLKPSSSSSLSTSPATVSPTSAVSQPAPKPTTHLNPQPAPAPSSSSTNDTPSSAPAPPKSTPKPSPAPSPKPSPKPSTTSKAANVTTDKPKETTTDKPKETPKPEPTTKKPTSTPKPAPKPTSTPKPVPVPIPAGSGKMGLIFTGNMPGAFRKASNTLNKKIWATYNWTPNKLDEVADTGIPFIPMFWGYKSIDGWGKVQRGYAKMALGCNEVNQPGQSQMSVGEGIDLWKKYLSPLTDKGYSLFSHSISNAPSGLNWLEDFRDGCKSCWDETAAVAIHYYSNNAQGMIDYLNDAHNRLGKKLIVTEFGCVDFSGGNNQCNVEQVKDFIEKTTNFMNKQSWIVSYFYFGSFTSDTPTGGVPGSSALFNDDGSFSSVGRTYVSS